MGNLMDLFKVDTSNWAEGAQTIAGGTVSFMKQCLNVLHDIRDNTEQVQTQRRYIQCQYGDNAYHDVFTVKEGTTVKIEYVSHLSASAQVVRLVVDAQTVYSSGNQSQSQSTVIPVRSGATVQIQAANNDTTEMFIVYSVWTPEPRKGTTTYESHMIDRIGTIGMDKHRPQANG